MMGFMMLVLLLVCLAEHGVAAYHHHHHGQFSNVAYGKHAVQSSRYSSHLYPASNAVNGLLTDFSHTGKENSPWLRIDLGRSYEVHEIEVFIRKGYTHVHDVEVRVGKRPHFNSMDFCGHFTGPTKLGQRFAVWCPAHTFGRYVQIQIVRGSGNMLDPTEVVVWGRL